ncbi:MAG: right-handed parallel beta-helix repeat-containing protein, partial [Thermoplasmata archaeon]|nr:right-handed parallel beta-helix repeat-containing protein [Thermoplasmata archaeon]
GFYWDLYMDGNCDFDRVTLEYLMNMTTTGTLSLDDSTLSNVRDSLDNTGTLTISNSDVSLIYNGIMLDGTTTIDGSDFSQIYKGINVSNDNVVVTNSQFDNIYDMGFYFVDCDAELNDVSIYISDGTAKSYWTTDHRGTWDDRFSMGMGIGIWVDGGNPSFTDVDVEVNAEAEFNVIWTGAPDTVRLYTRVLATAVLINSKDMTEVSGITAHDSYITCRGKFAASPTPFEFQVWMDAFSGGIGVVNYDDMTITGIESYDNSIGSLAVEVSGGSGYTGSRYSYQVVTAIVEDFTSSPNPSLTLENIKVSDGSYWFFHYYNPTYSGTGVPTFGNTVLVDNLMVDMAGSRVLTFELKAGDSDARNFDLDTRVTNSHFEGLNSEALRYYLSPGPGIDPTTSTVDITERFSFDNSTITECYYPWEYLVIGSEGPNMPSDFWDRIVTIADNDFVDTTGMFFYSWSQWGFVKGKDQLHVLNNNMRNTASTWGGPFYADGYDTIRFIGNTLTDMTYEETGDFYDYGGDDNGVKPTDWLFKDNTFDNCTNERWSEVIFLEFGGAVVFEGNEVMNMNGLVSIMHWTEYTGTASMDIIDNKFHDNTAYFVEFGNTDPGHVNFVMTIMNNEVYGNSDYFLTFWGSDSTITSNADDGMFIIEENNFHDNDGGIINVWGNVSVVNNTFTNNVGPLLDIEYIDLHIPALSGNVLANNQDLFMLVGKDLGYQLVSVSLSDQVLTCTGTALSFYNMEVTLDGVDIIGADTSIMARNSFVDVFGSTIDGDTCMVVGDGLITTWWPLEVYATWGDIEGNDGDIPVSEALVVFNTAEGDYYSSKYAGIDGILPQNLYPEWFVDVEGVRWNSP